ncbi:DUF2177 family protein [Devosia sp.]|uniref:DUF2177 family protein n=1 Tax=Devosia sp. TaxID=1871048 RepID=UPI002EDDDB1F
MLRYLVAYAATAVIFFAIDFIWLSNAVGFYRERLGDLLLDKPNLGYAAGFYLLYVAGIVMLAIVPALNGGTWVNAALAGAVLGLVAYGTYDMTNLSTLRNWSLTVSLVDMAWGTALTAVSAAGGYLLTRWLAG